jgi:peptidylprolyl isomerase
MKIHRLPFTLRPIICLCAVSLLAARGWSADTAIAQVDGEEIPVEKIRSYLENLPANDRATLEKTPALLNQAVRALILQQVLFQEAESADWGKRPEVVERLDRVRQGIIVDSYLNSVARVPDGYPSETEVKEAYEAKKDALVIPRQFQLAQIYIAQTGRDKTSADQAKQRIGEIHKKVKQPGADFGAVAQAESDASETAARNGEIGWLAESSIQPEIRSAIASLGKNGVSAPVQLDDGWYVIKVLDVKEPRVATFDEVKSQIVQLLRTERARLNREAYLAKLQQQHPVAINELALTKLLQPAKQ